MSGTCGQMSVWYWLGLGGAGLTNWFLLAFWAVELEQLLLTAQQLHWKDIEKPP